MERKFCNSVGLTVRALARPDRPLAEGLCQGDRQRYRADQEHQRISMRMCGLGTFWSQASALRSLAFLGITALCLSVLPVNLFAQSGAGSIQGTITDNTGAVVPGASVNVINESTHVQSSAVSNGAGFYQVPGLFAGEYSVTVTASGFKTSGSTIQLLVAQNAVLNAALSPGSVTEEVKVSASTVQLTTPDSDTITATLENQRINQLPMNGRNILTLLALTTPGMAHSGANIDGVANEGLEYESDGVPNFNDQSGGATNMNLQDPDSIQEVRIVAVDAGAQYSSPASAIITTKSGTNGLHGTFFETARNSAFGVAKRRQDPSNYAAPELIRNEFGASAGGPIVLPKVYHGKDKSFWFFAYERFSLASSPSILLTVPTMAMRQGDYSKLQNGQGIIPTIYDPESTYSTNSCAASPKNPVNPYCRKPFNGNQIPANEISPTAKVFYSLLPQPTSDADPLVQTNLTGNYKTYEVVPNISLRLDHVFDDNNRAYLRYTYTSADPFQNSASPSNPLSLGVDGIPAGAAEGIHNVTNTSDLAAVGYTHIFSPSFFAETILSQQWFAYVNAWGNASGINYESLLGLPNNFGASGFPAFGNGTLINNTNTSQNNYASNQIVSTIDENMTKIVGRNQFHFGGRFRHERIAYLDHNGGDQINFNAIATGVYDPSTGANYGNITNAGLADASLFIGSAAAFTIVSTPQRLHSHIMDFDAYIQDDYHLSKNLTVNLGLRYEAELGVWTKYGLGNSFDFANHAMVTSVPPSTLVSEGYATQPTITNDENIGVKFETPAEAGMPAGLMDNSGLNFLPRVGIAYQPFNGRYGTVLRGGYGRYVYFTPTANYTNNWLNNNPYKTSFVQSYTSAAQAIDGLPNELLRYNDPVEFGVIGLNTANVVNSNATNGILPGIGNLFTSPKWPPADVTETNFTIEQALKGNSALRVSWIWTHASNLDIDYEFNNHPTTYQWEMATGTVPPTGGAAVIGTSRQNTYAATATGPYDQSVWGTGMRWVNKAGWSNDNILQIDYQRLFHHGIAYEISYDFSKPLRAGGDVNENGSDFYTYPAANYPGVQGTVATMTSPYGAVYPGVLPPALPAGTPSWAQYHDLVKYENYQLDNTIPQHHVRFTGIVDLPFGRGKRFLGNANRFLDEVVGGFQVAGDGNVLSQVFQPNGGNWGTTNPITIYKHRHPITDCRSGVCDKSYLWFNGYLAPAVTTGVTGSTCTTNCVSGLPADYVPMQTPIDNTPGTTYYGKNEVQITAPNINKGAPTNIVFDGGPLASGYMAKTWLRGPFNYTVDLSVFKVFPITEKTALRFNVDAFNALNVQGYNNPGTDGVENTLSSYNAPRQLQFTLRLTF